MVDMTSLTFSQLQQLQADVAGRRKALVWSNLLFVSCLAAFAGAALWVYWQPGSDIDGCDRPLPMLALALAAACATAAVLATCGCGYTLRSYSLFLDGDTVDSTLLQRGSPATPETKPLSERLVHRVWCASHRACAERDDDSRLSHPRVVQAELSGSFVTAMKACELTLLVVHQDVTMSAFCSSAYLLCALVALMAVAAVAVSWLLISPTDCVRKRRVMAGADPFWLQAVRSPALYRHLRLFTIVFLISLALQVWWLVRCGGRCFLRVPHSDSFRRSCREASVLRRIHSSRRAVAKLLAANREDAEDQPRKRQVVAADDSSS